jgi:hypothetical protein
MAYDESTGRVVLFGGEVYQSGSGSTALNDVQEYDGVAGKWTNRTPYPLPTSWPQARMDHAMAYDPSRGKIVMCGGVTENGSGFPNEIWDWDSTQGTWTNRTLSPLPANGPGGCPSNGLAYSGNGMMAVFTGSSATSNFYRWDGVLGTWTNMAPSPLPTAWPKVGGNRLSTHLVWDSGRSTLVLTGALELQSSDPQIGLADIWEWTAP